MILGLAATVMMGTFAFAGNGNDVIGIQSASSNINSTRTHKIMLDENPEPTVPVTFKLSCGKSVTYNVYLSALAANGVMYNLYRQAEKNHCGKKVPAMQPSKSIEDTNGV